MREWLETYLAGAMATARPLGFAHYLRPLWQIIKSGNLAMQWLEQHEQGARLLIPSLRCIRLRHLR